MEKVGLVGGRCGECCAGAQRHVFFGQHLVLVRKCCADVTLTVERAERASSRSETSARVSMARRELCVAVAMRHLCLVGHLNIVSSLDSSVPRCSPCKTCSASIWWLLRRTKTDRMEELNSHEFEHAEDLASADKLGQRRAMDLQEVKTAQRSHVVVRKRGVRGASLERGRWSVVQMGQLAAAGHHQGASLSEANCLCCAVTRFSVARLLEAPINERGSLDGREMQREVNTGRPFLKQTSY